ncbi:MAG: pyridoxal 5'-phosphate synthase glutaminase subunit PdxT [Myxococcales bacterium]|nr:pyridoxal 5'-phosphate synthase glutaminase subunit PdxT [Myxococcales bacterium]MCB9731112.1 pyridoxal 5'-phosphate synthase glutaminase subunit PdxT [Deltaproteobacteria bacterium]
MRVGVLSLQGGYAAHSALLAGIGHEPVDVRTASALAGVDGLVLPGGESSTMLKLIGFSDLHDPLDAFVRAGRPVLATCAGLILAARRVTGPEQASFGWLDVDVARNAWGRQIESFEASADEGGLPLVFIRAPRLTRVGPGVTAVAHYEGEVVAVRQGPIVGASFHPELAGDATLHRLAFGDPGAP